jgi:acetylornithine aminotransferase
MRSLKAYTHSGGALQTRVAHHVLTKILSPGFLDGVRRSAARLEDRLARLPDLFPDHVAGPARGRGLIRGLPMTHDVLPAKVAGLCRERGVLLLTCGNATIRFVPSLVVTEAEVDKACDVLESALSLLGQEAKV